MNKEEANKIIRLFHKRKISFFSKGKIINTSVKKIIPMFDYGKAINGEYVVIDVEILTCKSKNTYFSIGCYVKNKSWIKSLEVKADWDDSIKQRVIAKDIQDIMDDIAIIATAKAIQEMEK